MSNNIVVLTGSPRQNGNTEILADSFIAGAKEAGKNVTVFKTADMKIGGCMGCGHCFEEKGVCIQKDDMPEILDTMKTSDVIVFVSPIYFFDMTAQLKLAIDRTYALLRVGTPIKKAAFLTTCGASSENAAQGAITTYKSMCAHSKWEDAGIIIVTGLHKPGEIGGRAELEKARSLGRDI